MHISLTFQLIIERLFFFQTSSSFRSIHTNQPQHIPFKNYNCHHSTTYISYFHHLFTHLLLHRNSHNTKSISFSRPTQPISPLHPQHPSVLSSPSHLLQTTHINHPLSQFLTNFYSPYSQTTYIPCPNPHPTVSIRPPVILQAMPARRRIYTLKGTPLTDQIPSV